MRKDALQSNWKILDASAFFRLTWQLGSFSHRRQVPKPPLGGSVPASLSLFIKERQPRMAPKPL